MRGIRHLLSLSGILVLLAIPAAGQQPAIVRVGTLKLVGGTPLFVAQDRGYPCWRTGRSQRAAAGTAVLDRTAYRSRRA